MGRILDSMYKGCLARHDKILTRNGNGIPTIGNLEASKKTELIGSKREGYHRVWAQTFGFKPVGHKLEVKEWSSMTGVQGRTSL